MSESRWLILGASCAPTLNLTEPEVVVYWRSAHMMAYDRLLDQIGEADLDMDTATQAVADTDAAFGALTPNEPFEVRVTAGGSGWSWVVAARALPT